MSFWIYIIIAILIAIISIIVYLKMRNESGMTSLDSLGDSKSMGNSSG